MAWAIPNLGTFLPQRGLKWSVIQILPPLKWNKEKKGKKKQASEKVHWKLSLKTLLQTDNRWNSTYGHLEKIPHSLHSSGFPFLSAKPVKSQRRMRVSKKKYGQGRGGFPSQHYFPPPQLHGSPAFLPLFLKGDRNDGYVILLPYWKTASTFLSFNLAVKSQ